MWGCVSDNLLWVQKSRTPEAPALQLVKHIIAYVVGEVPIGVGSPEGGLPKGCEPQGVLEPQVHGPPHTQTIAFFFTSGYPWRSDTIRPCLQARVAAFGSQDLGFRTSINGHWVSLSRPRFQDLDKRALGFTLRTWISEPQKLSILRSSYLFPVTFLCVHRHFSLRPTVTDARTHTTSDFIYKIGTHDHIK
jgi:hypothetical protein